MYTWEDQTKKQREMFETCRGHEGSVNSTVELTYTIRE
jgi:hypothetical protein